MKLRTYLFLLNGISIAAILISVAIIYHYMLLTWEEYVLISGITLGAAVVSLLIHAFLSHPLAKWVQTLAKETERVANGDFEAEVPRIGLQEFQRLAIQFNKMSGNLRELFARLHASEEARSELIANVSHDLRTPMASIQAFVEALQDDIIEDKSTFDRYLQTIRYETRRLNALIDDLFELSHRSAMELEQNRQSVAIDNLILETLQSQYLHLKERELQVDVQLPERIPSIWADTNAIKRALCNLLQNAIRYSPAGGSIIFEAQVTETGFVEIAVTDQGPGIDAPIQHRVFERFYREDRSRSRDNGGGAGLGLAIVKSIVEAHGGEVGVKSIAGEGSRFWLTIPMLGSVTVN